MHRDVDMPTALMILADIYARAASMVDQEDAPVELLDMIAGYALMNVGITPERLRLEASKVEL